MTIQGINILSVSEKIIPKENRHNGFYYDLRHGDNDWVTPVTIEKSVVVNYWGTIVTEKPLAFDYTVNIGCINLTKKQGYQLAELASH